MSTPQTSQKIKELLKIEQRKKAHYLADLLRAAHQRQADKLQCRIGNFGWVMTDVEILSKTDKGYLSTTRLGPRKYLHQLKS